MILSIEDVVWTIIWILCVGAIFGLLMYLITYVETNFPTMQPFGRFARIVLVVLGVLVLIGFILSFMGHPIIRFK